MQCPGPGGHATPVWNREPLGLPAETSPSLCRSRPSGVRRLRPRRDNVAQKFRGHRGACDRSFFGASTADTVRPSPVTLAPSMQSHTRRRGARGPRALGTRWLGGSAGTFQGDGPPGCPLSPRARRAVPRPFGLALRTLCAALALSPAPSVSPTSSLPLGTWGGGRTCPGSHATEDRAGPRLSSEDVTLGVTAVGLATPLPHVGP